MTGAALAAALIAAPAAAGMHLAKQVPPGVSATGGGEQRPPRSGGGPVLLVGDSLSVGIEPYLAEQLAGRALTADAETGRPSGVGVDVLRGAIRPEHDVVVFDLGTNDDPAAPEAFADDLASARALTGDRCLVVATINRPPVNGISSAGLNAAVERFAGRTPGVRLVDWRGAVAANPGLLAPDGVHATPDGYALRAQLFAQAIDACTLTAVPPELAKPKPAPQPKPQSRERPSAAPPSSPLPLLQLLLFLATLL